MRQDWTNKSKDAVMIYSEKGNYPACCPTKKRNKRQYHLLYTSCRCLISTIKLERGRKKKKNDIHYFPVFYQLNKTRRKNTATWRTYQLLSMCTDRLLSMELIKVTLCRRWGWHAALYLALGVIDCKCALKHRTKNEQWKCQGKNTKSRHFVRAFEDVS